MPEGVGALVESMSADEMTLVLVNTDQVEARTVIVQKDAYAEHQCLCVTQNGETTPLDCDNFTLHLGPGCGGGLKIQMARYANRPTCSFPWNR